ncbi:MAG TPA: hypothetical protein VHF22_11600 [Planctomycetota bacterium]|nr:hypothetical protein [Planctomycetota bacterium]
MERDRSSRAWLGAAALAAGLAAAAPARASTIYQEDFQGYPASTNLNGQGGWGQQEGGYDGVIYVTDGGSGLPGQVLNGTADGSSGRQNALRDLFDGGALTAGAVYTLTFDAFAFSGVSHNDGLGFHQLVPPGGSSNFGPAT